MIAYNRKIYLAIYIIFILLCVILPINSKNSSINHTYIFELRFDYVFHLLLFAPWTFLTPMKKKYWFWLLIGCLFAIFAEAIQYFLPYRSFNINDLIANIFGVIVGLFIYFSFMFFNVPLVQSRKQQ
jgi:VanZ family protein